MQLTLIAMALVAFMELTIYTPLWRWRWILAALILVCVIVTSFLFLIIKPSLESVLLLYFSLYRGVNLLRVIKGRIQVDYLYNSARRTSVWLIGIQVLIWGTTVLVSVNWFWVITVGQLLVALGLLSTASRNIKTTRLSGAIEPTTSRDIPTLTVAIPARNETAELENCLRTLAASTYPKLEIVVLDDSSQDKRTPEIIRGFAQQGVRFIPGDAPPEHWLPKNYAYKQLVEASNGELLLFCGVDTAFEPGSLTTLVQLMSVSQNDMLCLLPKNRLPGGLLLPLLVQPVRYAWELALPRRLLGRPPVLSTCWVIKRQFLLDAGSFEAVSRKIIPESYFARRAAVTAGGYSFVGADLPVTSSKSFSEQRATAIRTRYPQLHKRLELTGLLSLAEIVLFLWPVASIIAAVLNRDWLLAIVSAIGLATVAWLNVRMAALTYRQFLTGSLWSLPLAALYDICLLNYSMWQYEFGEVLWKGRNVCIPVMRSLPTSGSV